MTDCSSADVRDLLPDYALEQLDAEAASLVRAHLDGCGRCTAELELLRVARAVRPSAPVVDVARIVAALPKPPVAGAGTRGPVLVRSIDDARSAPTMGARRRASFGARRFTSNPLLRAAAALAVVALGSWTVYSGTVPGLGARAGASEPTRPASAPPLADSGTTVTVATAGASTGAGTGARAESTTSASRNRSSAVPARSAITMGDLSDLSNEELERMLERLERWDGTTATEPLPGVPLLPTTASTTERGAER
jgi:hypothetical protein